MSDNHLTDIHLFTDNQPTDNQPTDNQSNLPNPMMQLAVNGTLMRGLELNANLLAIGAEFIRADYTAPIYRLWSINDRHPAMLRVQTGGRSIAVEIWAVPAAGLATLLWQEPPGLCIGKVHLQDDSLVLGVLGEPLLCEGQLEITNYGGWRQYQDQVDRLGQA